MMTGLELKKGDTARIVERKEFLEKVYTLAEPALEDMDIAQAAMYAVFSFSIQNARANGIPWKAIKDTQREALRDLMNCEVAHLNQFLRRGWDPDADWFASVRAIINRAGKTDEAKEAEQESAGCAPAPPLFPGTEQYMTERKDIFG